MYQWGRIHSIAACGVTSSFKPLIPLFFYYDKLSFELWPTNQFFRKLLLLEYLYQEEKRLPQPWTLVIWKESEPYLPFLLPLNATVRSLQDEFEFSIPQTQAPSRSWLSWSALVLGIHPSALVLEIHTLMAWSLPCESLRGDSEPYWQRFEVLCVWRRKRWVWVSGSLPPMEAFALGGDSGAESCWTRPLEVKTENLWLVTIGFTIVNTSGFQQCK